MSVPSIDGVSDKFRFKRGLPDANLLAKARAFIDEIPPFKADFIAFGMPATFDTALNTAANAFEATFGAVDSATAEHISGTATVAVRVREGMVIIRTLDGVAKNVYAFDPGKFAAWVAASHVQKSPSPPSPPAPPPSPPTP